MISDLPIVKMEDENKKQLWTFLVLYFINKNQYINDTYEKLIYSKDNGCHENQLNEQPALSPLVGISFIVLLNTPYKWIIWSDICCMQISGFDCTTTLFILCKIMFR